MARNYSLVVSAPSTPSITLPIVPTLVEMLFSGKSPRTIQTYRQGFERLRKFLGVHKAVDAISLLLTQSPIGARSLALAFQAHLRANGLTDATVRTRLAPLRAIVKLARSFDLVRWDLNIHCTHCSPYRDTRGPGATGYLRMLETLDGLPGTKARRDKAIVRLLFDLALRRGELVALDVDDLNLFAGTVSVHGKGRAEVVLISLPEPTLSALQGWMDARGGNAGPLFTNFDRARKGRRLTGRSVARIVAKIGRLAGLRKKVRPHGLRHAAITAALDRTDGDVRAVQRFSRHKDPKLTLIYDDNRLDLAGQVANLVARPSNYGKVSKV